MRTATTKTWVEGEDEVAVVVGAPDKVDQCYCQPLTILTCSLFKAMSIHRVIQMVLRFPQMTGLAIPRKVDCGMVEKVLLVVWILQILLLLH